MKRARQSEVWNFFTVDSEEKKLAKCNICLTRFSFKGTVSNLNKHLRNKHLITAPTKNTRVEHENISTEPVNSDNQNTNAVVGVVPSTSSQTETAVRTPTILEPQTSSFQSTLRMYATTKKLSSKQGKEIDDALMSLFFKSFLPFSIVEDKHFKKFVFKLNPAYQLPSRKHVSNTLLDAEYHTCVKQVKEELSTVVSACLTIDCWTSRAQEGYLAVTAHYIDGTFNLQTALLQCQMLSGPHTAVNLSTELRQVINDWNLDKKIKLVVSDNAPNVQNCIKDLQLKNFGCFAHTINLIAKHSLMVPEVECFLSKLRAIVSHFKRSTTAVEKLLKYQVNNNVPLPKKLIIDVATRWNSTFYMLERALLLKEALTSTVAILDSVSSSTIENMNAEEWRLCKDLCTVLKPLEQVTAQISGEKYLTGSLVIIFNRLLRNVYAEKISHSATLHTDALAVSNRILHGLITRLNNIEMSGTFGVATFLDPRFKMAFFMEKRAAEAAKKRVIELMVIEINKEAARQESSSSPTISAPTPISPSVRSEETDKPYEYIDIWEDIDTQEVSTLESPTAIAIAEVQRYINEKMLPRNASPNEWWRKHYFLYPNLSQLFKLHCCVLATSVPCERIFSKSGELISDRRTRLSSEKVKKLMFLSTNKKLM